jgi:hypothetical protein
MYSILECHDHDSQASTTMLEVYVLGVNADPDGNC